MESKNRSQIQRGATFVKKGGVGKTTTAGHVGVAAATDHNLDVILLDLTDQNDLFVQFGIYDHLEDDDGDTTIDVPVSAVFRDDWDLIANSDDNILDRMTYHTSEGVDLIPSDPGLGGADNTLANAPVEDRYTRLNTFVKNTLAPEYDFVLFDLPGAENNIALNGLFAAEHVIAPLKPGKFESEQLDRLDRDLEAIRDAHPVDPQLTMVVPTMIDGRTNLSERFLADLRDEANGYPKAVAPAPVDKSQGISNTQDEGRTLFAVADDELSSTAQRAREAYRTNTTELLTRLTTEPHE